MSNYINTTCLMGPPGTGKTVMACLTAVNTPVHVVDIDRKIATMALLRPALENGMLTYTELDESLAEETLTERAMMLSLRGEKRQAPTKKPNGWIKFDEILRNLPKKDEFKACKTLLIDSYTVLALHLERLISFHSGTFSFTHAEWGTLYKMMTDATASIIDFAREGGKDLIITVHERDVDVPNENTRVSYTPTKDGTVRSIMGSADMKIAASINGQFGRQIGLLFTEFYGLEVRTNTKGEPVWKCRVKPDGKRSLRTSYDVGSEVEFDPDFRKIWRKR